MLAKHIKSSIGACQRYIKVCDRYDSYFWMEPHKEDSRNPCKGWERICQTTQRNAFRPFEVFVSTRPSEKDHEDSAHVLNTILKDDLAELSVTLNREQRHHDLDGASRAFYRWFKDVLQGLKILLSGAKA